MSLVSSARSFIRRVRADGVACIPEMVYTRLMTLIHRDVLRRENADRQAETDAYQGWIARHTQPEAAPFEAALTLSCASMSFPV